MASATTQNSIIGACLPAVTLGAGTGTAGLLGGSIVAVVRSTPRPAIFAIGTGINCFLLGTTYGAVRQQLVKRLSNDPHHEFSPRQRTQISAIASSMTGALGGFVLRGRANVIPGAIVFGIFGLTTQMIYNKVDARNALQMEAVAQHDYDRHEGKANTFIERVLRADSSPVKRLSDHEYKSMLGRQVLVINADIAIVDDEIQRLQDAQKTKDANHRHNS